MEARKYGSYELVQLYGMPPLSPSLADMATSKPPKKNKKKRVELGTRALMNSVLYARCLVMVGSIHLDSGQRLWYKYMEHNGLLVGMPTCSAETLLIKFSLLTGCTLPVLGPY